MEDYISRFLKLRSAGNILNTVVPVNGLSKEITESVAIWIEIKKIALHHKEDKRILYELCAGNALTSILSLHTLPISEAIAIDKRERKRNWHLTERFSYLNTDITKLSPDYFAPGSIIIGVHACKDLSSTIIDLYNRSQAQYLIIMPCCVGSLKITYTLPKYLSDIVGRYDLWAIELANSCIGKTKIKRDLKILSPKNYVIVAKKE
uniref:Putative methyltransferase n=2 Tax=viral metagenome TaxID=1070528 RepID=A0A6M3JAP8_9ZZZZ